MPESLGHFLIIDILGEGGMGTVFETLTKLAFDRDEEAITLLEDVSARREHVQGPSHPAALVVRGHRCNPCLKAGDDQFAHAVLSELLEHRQARDGRQVPRTLVTMERLAKAETGLGHHARAIELLEVVVATRRRTLGHDNRLTRDAEESFETARRSAESSS